MFDAQGPTFFELAQQALSSTTRGYDLLAPKFEHTPFRTPDALVDPTAAVIGAIGAALDIGCGTGAGMRMLRPLCASHVTGADLSQGMLDQARSLLADAPGSAELRYVQADARDLPFDAEFDVITCFGALGHFLVRDQPALAESVKRALVPGGRFLFVTSNHPSPIDPMFWMAHGFNWAMHVRNAVIDPPFVMYYLTFTLPHAADLLRAHGFTVEVKDRVYPKFPTAKLVVATRPR